MRNFAQLSIENIDRELNDEELIDDVPVQIEVSQSILYPAEETKNLVVKRIAKNQGKGKRIKVDAMPIPRAFDLNYYQDKIDKSNFNSDRIGAIRAFVIKRYADISYEFYRQVMHVFYKKNSIFAMPEYIQMCERIPGDIETLAKTMMERERGLIRAFNGTDKLKSAFKVRKHLTELKLYSAKAWMMYFNLKNLKDFIGELVNNQNTYNKANKENPSHIANLYGLHVQAGYYIDANIKNFFNVDKNGLMSKMCPSTCSMYDDLNSMEEFNAILKENNAYIYNEKHEEIVCAAKNILNSTEERTTNKRIIGFYNHYRDMKYVKHQLRRIYNSTKNETVNNVNILVMFNDMNNVDKKYQYRDIYKVACMYYSACKDLVEELPIKSKIYKDVCDICVELEELLAINEDNYIIYQNAHEKAKEKALIKFPHLKKQFEEEDKQKKTRVDTISSMET